MKQVLDVMVIGSGGRESALIFALANSGLLGRLYVAPGNDGMPTWVIRVPFKVSQITELADFAEGHSIGLTIVGPENPLAEGMVNVFQRRGLKIFGPTKAAAKLESSKSFAVKMMQALGIPCPATLIFDSLKQAQFSVSGSAFPLVLKADGLCAGKGVKVCHTKEEATSWLKDVMQKKIYGKAGNKVLIQEFLRGQELTYHALCDGKTAKLFPAVQDHKQLLDGDKGPMTGGMGAFGPVPWVTPETDYYVLTQIVEPVLKYMAKKRKPFVGCLYIGIMMIKERIKVLEFNVRFGDPETQVYMPLLKTDVLELCQACIDKRLHEMELAWSKKSAVCVTLASEGYPDKPRTGQLITGIERADKIPEVVVFQAGVARNEKGQHVVAGGRAIYVTAMLASLQKAIQRANQAADLVQFEGKIYRTDIGRRSAPEFL